jgi:protein-tyrosine phosphatase
MGCKSHWNWIIKNELAVGDWEAGTNLDQIRKDGFGAVLSATRHPPHQPEAYENHGLNVMRILIKDKPSENISQYFPKAYKFINANISNGRPVMVHCAAGRSRSVSLIVSYLIKKYAMTPLAALNYVRLNRPCEIVNKGFIKQLNQYGKQLGTI